MAKKKVTKPKFEIGQKVIPNIEEKPKEGVVESMTYSPQQETFIYQISAKTVDIEAEELIEGIRNYLQDELDAVEEETENE